MQIRTEPPPNRNRTFIITLNENETTKLKNLLGDMSQYDWKTKAGCNHDESLNMIGLYNMLDKELKG